MSMSKSTNFKVKLGLGPDPVPSLLADLVMLNDGIGAGRRSTERESCISSTYKQHANGDSYV